MTTTNDQEGMPLGMLESGKEKGMKQRPLFAPAAVAGDSTSTTAIAAKEGSSQATIQRGKMGGKPVFFVRSGGCEKMSNFFPSVIVLTYGRVRHLENALACLLAQDYPGEFEILVFNSCSEQTLVFDSPLVRIVNAKRPGSLGACRNEAIEYASGSHILIHDDDDACLPNFISTFARGFADGSQWVQHGRQFYALGDTIKDIVRGTLNAVGFTREAWIKAGKYANMGSGEDRNFFGRLTAACSGRVLDIAERDTAGIYNWGQGTHHISGLGEDSPRNNSYTRAEADLKKRLRNKQEPSGTIVLQPKMRCNWPALTHAYLEKHGWLREKINGVGVIQMGRFGDIINTLPICKKLHEDGENPHLIVSREFASVLDGVSYVTPWVQDYPWIEIDRATRVAQSQFSKVLRLQLYGNGHKQERHTGAFNMEQWREAGMLSEFHNPEHRPIFDRRDEKREALILAKLFTTNKPKIVTNLTRSLSSPFRNGSNLLSSIRQAFKATHEVVEIGNLKLHRIYDLLAVIEKAALFISVDTATLHLAAATNTPVLALVNNEPWLGSVVRFNAAAVIRYADVTTNRVIGAINNAFLAKQTITFASGSEMVLAYLPPDIEKFHPDVFLNNIQAFPPACSVGYISDQNAWPFAYKIKPAPFNTSDKIAAYVFLTAMRVAKARGVERVLWLETDCRVSGKDWDKPLLSACTQEIVAAGHLAVANLSNGSREFSRALAPMLSKSKLSRSPILPQWWNGKHAIPFVNGAPAAYQVAEITKLYPREPEKEARQMATQDRDIGERLVRAYSDIGALRRLAHAPTVTATAGEVLFRLHDRISAIMAGDIQIVHPIKSRWTPPPSGKYRLYHSGDLGDIIYCLATAALLGDVELYLGPNYEGSYPPRMPISKTSFQWLHPLIATQPYISLCEYTSTLTKHCLDMNRFRDFWNTRHVKGCVDSELHLLADAHAYTAGVLPMFKQRPWLSSKPRRIAKYVINRSARYHADFPWLEFVSNYGSQSVFVGLKLEHECFCTEFGNVSYIPTESALDMAEIIAGAEWFVGNQSLPNAIAIGLGKNVFQEAWKGGHDCEFKTRSNLYTQYDHPLL